MIGPGLERRMPIAASASTGASTTSATAASPTSSRRLAMAHDASHRHEHLGGVETALVAPRLGAMPQRLERTRMGVGPDLALVARHGRELALQRGRDVDPRVRHEAA